MAATNFKQHTIFNIIIFFGIIALASFHLVKPMWAYSFLGAYLFATLYSPDVDLADHRSYANSFGKVPFWKAIWKFSYIIWWPYAKVMGHRGLSHVPVLGTLTRVAYLLVIPVVCFVPVSYFSSALFAKHKVLFLCAFVGWSVADIMHILLDHVGSALTLKNFILILFLVAIIAIIYLGKTVKII